MKGSGVVEAHQSPKLKVRVRFSTPLSKILKLVTGTNNGIRILFRATRTGTRTIYI